MQENAVTSCPKCASKCIMVIDIAVPPQMFECASCSHRFHRMGFTTPDVDMKVGISPGQELVLGLIHK